MKWLSKLWQLMFPTLSEGELVARELHVARLQLLQYLSEREYVEAMIDYNRARVSRLSATN